MRAAKVHLADTGLACHLLAITSPEQLRRHPLRGAIFGSWVAAEIRKSRANRGIDGGMHHYRETRGAEIDAFIQDAETVRLVEVKSGATVAGDWFDGLVEMAERSAEREVSSALVYGGDRAHVRRGVRVLPWPDAGQLGES